MPRAQANGIEIEYESLGSGPSLVLINGYGGSHHSLEDKRAGLMRFADEVLANM